MTDHIKEDYNLNSNKPIRIYFCNRCKEAFKTNRDLTYLNGDPNWPRYCLLCEDDMSQEMIDNELVHETEDVFGTK